MWHIRSWYFDNFAYELNETQGNNGGLYEKLNIRYITDYTLFADITQWM